MLFRALVVCTARIAGCRAFREGIERLIDTYADRWALVTGASSGIGAEFARRLAALGMHLILVARREEPMDQLAEELHTRHGTRTRVLPHDLTDPQAVLQLEEQIRSAGTAVELLVNNAGFAIVGDLDAAEPQRVQELIRLNIAALTQLTYAVLPGMVERGHGAVINLASVAAFQPVAYMAAYAASKAYVLHFSEAMWAEMRDHGVTVMALCPGVTRTPFFDVAGVPGWLKKQRSQTPEQVVRNALTALEKNRQYTVSGLRNYLLSLAVRLAPRRTVVLESMKYFRPVHQQEQPPQSSGAPTESAPQSGRDE